MQGNCSMYCLPFTRAIILFLSVEVDASIEFRSFRSSKKETIGSLWTFFGNFEFDFCRNIVRKKKEEEQEVVIIALFL
jgi:hypothetical protein